ncbi:hypothetical protein BS47DRAFT_1361503 [Hydnum rufescens UP504]|uniref:NACHT domain-containing protein n=1 Tax=Hydnum rufescens UP504 TaxID=1448309 RepID=A0A9P6AZB2_9AGAM|nr:hypothetical protein BS47DRAFT_1361503 [Hydnum rufescens UP504]
MKRSLKPGKTAKGISLEILQSLHHLFDAIPVPGAKAGIGISSMSLKESTFKTSRNSATLLELEKHLRFLTDLLESLMKMDRSNISSGLKDDVERLSKDLESISSNLKSKSSGGRVRRFLERKKDEDDLPTFAQNIKAALDRFHLCQILRQEQELRFGVRIPALSTLHLLTSRCTTERSVAVMSLPRAHSAAYDSSREDTLLSCLEGTRVPILAEIISWFESTESGTPPVYWLMGLAGIGKSTIAKTVAERVDENGILGGSFFFSRSDARLRDPNLVFPTLAFQLAQFDNEFKNVIGEAARQDPTLGHKKPLAQFKGLILEPLGEHATHPRTTLIILDALDECEEQGAATILQVLLSHITQLPFLRILITSRPEPHISSVFDEARNHAKRILHDIQASLIEEDIRHYIRSQLREIPKRLGLHMGTDWATEGEINTLVEKSGKLFIFAATSIRFIGDARVRDPRGHLRLILDTQLTKESEATPYSQLDSLYVGVLRNSLSDSNRKAVVKRFQTVVGSIVLLRQPLPLGSLARFLQYELDDVDTVLLHLRSVIIPPATLDEAPHIYHPSFRDFITDPSRCSLPDFVIVALPDQELRHALRCFDLMARFLKRDIAGILDFSLLNSEVKGLEEKVRGGLSAEVQYACRYWASHLSCVEFGEKRTVEALCRNLDGRGAPMGDASQFILAHRDGDKGEVVEAQWPPNSSTMMGHSGPVVSVVFSPNGLRLLSGSWDETLCLWDAISGVYIATLQGHSHWVSLVAFSPDGLWLASGSYDHTICLWDAMSGAQIATLQGHSGCISLLAFSCNGLQLVSGSDCCTLCLWDATSGAYIATLQGHSNLVTSVAFSPDSLWLVSGSDNTLCLWDAVLGVHIATLQGHSNWIFSVSFSSDGHTLISQSHSETFAWDLRSQPLQLVPTSIPRAPPSTISHSSLFNSEVGGWIQAMDSEDNVAHICYIPPHYHSSTTVQASSLATQPWIAIGCADGHVIIVDPQDHPFVHGHEGVVTFS